MQPQVENDAATSGAEFEPEIVEQEEARPVTEVEKRLRRDVARYREQARMAQTERDAACAAAVRERDTAIAAANEQAQDRVLRAELKSAALRAGILDLDALRLADTSTVGVGENGDLTGIDDVVSALKQHKPYLFGSEMRSADRETTTQLQKPPSPALPGAMDARNLSREAWHAERDRLLSRSR